MLGSNFLWLMRDGDVSSGFQQFVEMKHANVLDLFSPRALLLTLATVLVCFIGLSYVSPAHADYRFCNHTSYVLSSSISFEKDKEWKSQGWYRLLPGSCRAILRGKIKNETYYVFAQSVDEHAGGRKYFSGSERFCSVPGDFLITGRTNCTARGFDSNDFTRVEAKIGTKWSTTFMEPRAFSQKQAKTAGVQRLLTDNNYKNIKVDGYGGRSTQRAIMAFQRSININPTGKITDALFEALLKSAQTHQEKTGLNICNKTDFLVWSAVGYETADGDISNGWIKIEPDRCVKAIKGTLEKRYYYTYAEAVDSNGIVVRDGNHDLMWGGGHTFCTKTTKFEINGRSSCQDRGFTETDFKQIDTGEAGTWTLNLE